MKNKIEKMRKWLVTWPKDRANLSPSLPITTLLALLLAYPHSSLTKAIILILPFTPNDSPRTRPRLRPSKELSSQFGRTTSGIKSHYCWSSTSLSRSHRPPTHVSSSVRSRTTSICQSQILLLNSSFCQTLWQVLRPFQHYSPNWFSLRHTPTSWHYSWCSSYFPCLDARTRNS